MVGWIKLTDSPLLLFLQAQRWKFGHSLPFVKMALLPVPWVPSGVKHGHLEKLGYAYIEPEHANMLMKTCWPAEDLQFLHD